MCGRYSLGVRMAFVRQRLEQQGMQVNDAPGDDEVRETYNFAPGYNGVVYCADPRERSHAATRENEGDGIATEKAQEEAQQQGDEDNTQCRGLGNECATRYKLQSMRWGLIPFWAKRMPDYGSLMQTINCRDDSLIEDRGMWTSMKRKKRCIVVCQGFYEWLKKGPGGKEKVPHFVKRRDGELMCFAGLWDCVRYEGSNEELYTYTIITTSSNPYLKFLHDRMPVVLDQGSKIMKTWLDPKRTTWSKDLQSILNPYEGELECYPVSKEVGKVGNNSPDFLVPVNSKENKSNIVNFFANAKQRKGDEPVKTKDEKTDMSEQKVTKDGDENRTTQDNEWSKNNAPVPVPGVKREHPPDGHNEIGETEQKKQKTQSISPSKQSDHKPVKKADGKKSTDGSQRITNFFRK